MKLNNENIRRAQVGDVLRDDTVAGLHLRVLGKRSSYYLYYRTRDGKERRPKLGDHPAMSLAKARTAAKKILGDVAAGSDPAGEWRAARQERSVKDLCERYMEDRGSRRKSKKEKQRMIDKYVLPAMGAMRVPEVGYEHIAAVHTSMGATPYQANRVLALLSTLFNYAEVLTWRAQNSNPCRGVERYRERKRKRYMQGDEAVKIAGLLEKYKAKYPRAVLFIYLLILTGARPDEVARFAANQRQGDKILLDDHKTDGHGEPRAVHLPPQAVSLLDALANPKDGTLVGVKSPKHLWVKLRVEAGCPDLRLYDLRHTFASAALAAGYTLNQIGELLGHSSTQTTKRYTHLIDEMAAAAASNTADYLTAMMQPKKAIPG